MNLWLKIKVWTKLIVLALVVIYALFFIAKNSETIEIWYWFYAKKLPLPTLLLIFVSILVGVLGTVLARTTINTLRQIRELRERNRAERDAKELADMRAKAAMLHTRPEATEEAE